MHRLIAACLLAATAVPAHADPGPVFHAGQWETIVTNPAAPDQKPIQRLVCHKADATLDSKAISAMMAGAKSHCSEVSVTTSGAVTTYSLVCQVGEMKIVSSGTMTEIGPDSFTGTSSAHAEGGKMSIPDMKMSTVARRLGPCQPGDAPSPY